MIDKFASARASLAATRYLMTTPIPWYVDADGKVWLGRLWERDLRRHFDYISHMILLGPRLPKEQGAAEDLVPVDLPAGAHISFQHLPVGKNTLSDIFVLPAKSFAALRAVRGADIVHSGVAGWPIPPGLPVNIMAVLFRKPLVIVIESAFWRVDSAKNPGIAARLRARLTEAFARWSAKHAALSVFTHDGYRDSLRRPNARGSAIVTPATWIDSADVLDLASAEAAWDAKPAKVRYVMAGRLVEGKGVALLLDSLRAADKAGLAFEVDIMGEGPMRDDILATAEGLGHVKLRWLPPLAYGPPFSEALRSYHALLVPTLSDEQPRIIYDAFAQAVPVIASDTPGNRAAVIDGQTGYRFAPGSDEALLALMKNLATAPDELRQMGLVARQIALGSTHQLMHLTRADALAVMLTNRQ